MKIRALLFALCVASTAACSDDGGNQPKDAGVDASGTPDASCFDNPTTHAEIINACTTAQKIPNKKPNLPLLKDDGTVPQLPP